jgi:hypothetical protein
MQPYFGMIVMKDCVAAVCGSHASLSNMIADCFFVQLQECLPLHILTDNPDYTSSFGQVRIISTPPRPSILQLCLASQYRRYFQTGLIFLKLSNELIVFRFNLYIRHCDTTVMRLSLVFSGL